MMMNDSLANEKNEDDENENEKEFKESDEEKKIQRELRAGLANSIKMIYIVYSNNFSFTKYLFKQS